MAGTAIILGSGSDIGHRLAEQLELNGWNVCGYRHDRRILPRRWDLIVCCYGTLQPIGPFWGVSEVEFVGAFQANLFQPLRQVRYLYPYRNPGASVCFFSGAGASGPAPTYAAYAASKVALTKMVELMDDESPDCKFFILGPGMMRTKIQEQTLAAGPERAANYERVRAFMDSESDGTSIEVVYGCLMACVEAPKAAVGGRNIYVPGDDWLSRLGELVADRDAFKLRRHSNELLR
jgi:NAD(P)-dependent dehydrogenase (short-subunit alcohol dehydrogenase family)